MSTASDSNHRLVLIIVFSQVQINNSIRQDTFAELPVSLMLFSLICIDILERIRHCRLTGHGESAKSSVFCTHV